MHRVCICVFLITKGITITITTPGLKSEVPNLFCVYARVGEEKETQTQVFWELIWRAYRWLGKMRILRNASCVCMRNPGYRWVQ